MTISEDPVVFIMPGDLHLTEAGLDNHRAALWAVEQANTLIRPDFVQFIGDNVQDGTEAQFRLFRDLTGRFTCPWYALVGDHDAQGDPLAESFRRFVGEPTGATALCGFRFLRLNTQEAQPVGLSPGQVAWFREQADAALAAGERVVVFQHNYPFQIWETFDGPGIDSWREVVQTRRITGTFCGHTHYLQAANDGRNVSVAVRSIGDPEGGNPGYLLAYLHGDDLAFVYRTIRDEGPAVLITRPRDKLLATGPAHVVSGPGQARVRVWSDREMTRVEARLDGGDWLPMASLGPQDWGFPLPALEKGDHRFEARATDEAGRSGVHAVTFAADPTGRYTAVPAAWPVVRETRFC
jgi:diadenosine tetraphosphatase ApaH/serine/threonine PP2A family protein phosphatase